MGQRLMVSLMVLSLAAASGPLVAAEWDGSRDVYVRADAEEGRGLVRSRSDGCYVITPHHVVQDAFEISVHGQGGVEVDAELHKIYPQDIAILAFSDTQLPCPVDWPASKDLGARLEKADTGTLISRSSGGGQRRMGVRIEALSDVTIAVSPLRENDRIAQGMSGSLFRVGGKAAGMLMAVDTRTGRGQVLRFDYLTNAVAVFFDRETVIQSPTSNDLPIEPLDQQGFLTKDATVRAAPDVFSASVARIGAGKPVHVIGRVRGRLWYKLRLDDGGEGFVRVGTVRIF